MSRLWLAIAVGFGAVLVSGPGYAGSDPATTQGTLPPPVATPPADAPLVLSIRSLSVTPMTFTDGGQLERVTAPTGSGTSTWPAAATHIGRGVYISVTPGCIPGVDEPALARRRAPTPLGASSAPASAVSIRRVARRARLAVITPAGARSAAAELSPR